MLSTGLHNVQRRVDSKNTSSFIASSRHIVGVFMLNMQPEPLVLFKFDATVIQ